MDEFAHTNVPGSERAKRWEDVLVLLDAGMDVVTTMNVQHLESINDQVRQITGIQVRETVPDWVVKEAGEIVMVDLTPAALIHRLERGAVYAPEKASRALENFFKESNLVALREMALRQAAHEVDVRQEGGGAAPERFLVYVTDQPSTANLIRRAWRVADYLQAACFAVHVRPRFEPQSRAEAVEKHLNFARDLHMETRVIEGDDPALTVGAIRPAAGSDPHLHGAPTLHGRTAAPQPQPDPQDRAAGQGHTAHDRGRAAGVIRLAGAACAGP